MKNKIFLLGVGFNNLRIHDVLELMIKGLEKSEEKYYIVTPNPEILVLANNDPVYKKVINNAKLALPDGIGVMMASRLLSKPLRWRIHGVDLMESICREVSKRPITVGFLGGGANVAESAAECLRVKYPGLKINFTEEEWNFEKKHPETDILFVAFGSPKATKRMSVSGCFFSKFHSSSVKLIFNPGYFTRKHSAADSATLAPPPRNPTVIGRFDTSLHMLSMRSTPCILHLNGFESNLDAIITAMPSGKATFALLMTFL